MLEIGYANTCTISAGAKIRMTVFLTWKSNDITYLVGLKKIQKTGKNNFKNFIKKTTKKLCEKRI